MLRASSLGLTFIHGISRYSPFQSRRLLRKYHGHEAVLLVTDSLCSYSTKTMQMAKKIPALRGLHNSPDPLLREHPTACTVDAPPVALGSHAETQTLAEASSCTYVRTREVTSSAVSVVGSHPPSSPITLQSTATVAVRPPPLPPEQALKDESAFSVPDRRILREHRRRKASYTKLVETADMDEAWNVYQTLLKDCPPFIKQPIPSNYLHGFAARLLSASDGAPSYKMRTQKTFLRLISVLSTIYHTSGQVRLWEWNALIQCAGSGWRRTRLDDFYAALNVYRDMVANRAPGASLSDEPYASLHDDNLPPSMPATPDIVTYTTLFTIAARTRNTELVQHVESMMSSAGVLPNRITLLSYLRYYTQMGQLSGVRTTLARMKRHCFELGIDGINGCIWAYGRNGRLDIATLIYRILRHRLPQEGTLNGDGDVEDAVRELDELEDITVPAGLRPDAVTYYTLIQVYAFRGRLHQCLDVLTDMMTSPVRVTGALKDVNTVSSEPQLPEPILPVFRAIFHGFARHTTLPQHTYTVSAAVPHGERHSQIWTLGQLQLLFEKFIDLPPESKPNSRTVYSLLLAYAISSGYDRELLRSVWEKLASRYGTYWDGRVEKFRAKVFQEEFDERYFEDLRTSRDRVRN